MYAPSFELASINSTLQSFNNKCDKSFSSSLTKAAIAPDFFPYTFLITFPTVVSDENSCTPPLHSTLIILVA